MKGHITGYHQAERAMGNGQSRVQPRQRSQAWITVLHHDHAWGKGKRTATPHGHDDLFHTEILKKLGLAVQKRDALESKRCFIQAQAASLAPRQNHP